MEDLLKLQATFSELGCVTVTKAAGAALLVPFARRSGAPATPGDFAAQTLQRKYNVDVGLTVDTDTMCTLMVAGDVVGKLSTFVSFAADGIHKTDASCLNTRGGVIRGFTASGACHTVAIFTTTSETQEVWAWAFWQLNDLAVREGLPAIVSTHLLHDCVPSTFYAVASVLPSLLHHHYCAWHVIEAYKDRVTKALREEADVMDADLRTSLGQGVKLATLLTQQRERVVHAYNSLILTTSTSTAAVLLQSFLKSYGHNERLMDLMCNDDIYGNLSAVLLCFLPTHTRAINAVSENFMRVVRHLQLGPQGGRVSMFNFAGALLLLAHAYFHSLAAEADRDFRAAKSTSLRAPVPGLPQVPPLPTAARPEAHLPALPADPRALDAGGLEGMAALASAPNARLHGLPLGAVHRFVGTTLTLAAGGTGAPRAPVYEQNLRDMASYKGGYYFSQLLRNHRQQAYIVSPSDAADFASALKLAQKDAEAAWRRYVEQRSSAASGSAEDGAQPLESAGARALEGGGAAASSSAVAAPAAHQPASAAQLLPQLLATRTFGGAKRKRERASGESAYARFSTVLPAIQDFRANGRPVEGARELRSTVAPLVAGVPGLLTAIPQDARRAILHAYKALPVSATVLLADLRQLFQRPSGIMRADAATLALRYAPMRRSAITAAMVARAFAVEEGGETMSEEEEEQ